MRGAWRRESYDGWSKSVGDRLRIYLKARHKIDHRRLGGLSTLASHGLDHSPVVATAHGSVFHRATLQRQRAVAAPVFQRSQFAVTDTKEYHLVIQGGPGNRLVGELGLERSHVLLIEWKRMVVGNAVDAVDGHTLAGYGNLLGEN